MQFDSNDKLANHYSYTLGVITGIKEALNTVFNNDYTGDLDE